MVFLDEIQQSEVKFEGSVGFMNIRTCSCQSLSTGNKCSYRAGEIE